MILKKIRLVLKMFKFYYSKSYCTFDVNSQIYRLNPNHLRLFLLFLDKQLQNVKISIEKLL